MTSDPDRLLGELLDWAEEKNDEGANPKHIVDALEGAKNRLEELGYR